MADIWMDVDTALAEVPVNKVPLMDDTDFKTREISVAYNAAGMDLVWNFVTSAGAFTQTAVTPTTAGTYDWVNQGKGFYTIEIPASGGASINNDTEGYGWFTGFATGVLPWTGPIIGFRAAAINDSLCDTNTTGILAPTTAGRTLDVSAGGEAGLDWANIGSPTTAVNLSATNIDVDQVVASVSGAVGSVGAGGITATSLASDTITAAKVAADVSTEIRDKMLERTTLRGTVSTSSTTTSVTTSAMSPATSVADQVKGRIIIFDQDTTTAALRGQATDITASSASATPTLTVTALTNAPASGDTFTIV